jgi:putative aldouronate transport system substrate-binding protein
MKIINFIYDETRNDATAATDYPEIADYRATAVDGTSRPFNIEINPSTELLETVSDAQAVLNGKNQQILLNTQIHAHSLQHLKPI